MAARRRLGTRLLDREMTTPPEHVLPDRQLLILTGAQGAGKSTTCRRLLDGARAIGLDCAGILSPARFEGGVKVGIDVVDARTDERRRLADVDDLPGRLRAGPYRFGDSAVAWGIGRLGVACPCDLLIVDEIGPLEIDRGEGWVNALEVLRAGEYRLAVAVVRPSLVDAVRTAVCAAGTVLFRGCHVPGPDLVGEVLSLVQPRSATAREP
jgi:nucleoside-triphosphatase THEP1